MNLQDLAITKPMSSYDFLNRLIEVIEEEPRRIRMKEWQLIDRTAINGMVYDGVHAGVPACGVVGCLSGWSAILLGNPEAYTSWLSSAFVPRSLGLDQLQVNELFLPAELMGTDGEATGTPEYAQKVIEHVRRFQAKHERQLRETVVLPFNYDYEWEK